MNKETTWMKYEEWLFFKYFMNDHQDIPQEYLDKFKKIEEEDEQTKRNHGWVG